jgi:signal transduction histidine kinase
LEPSPHPDPATKAPLSWRGLTLQLFGIVFLPLSVLLIAVTVGSQLAHQNEMRAMVGERDGRAVRATAIAIQSEIEHRASLVQSLALQAATAPADDLQSILESYAGSSADFQGGLALLTPQGKLLASTRDSAFWDQILTNPALEKVQIPPPESGITLSAPFQIGAQTVVVVTARSKQIIALGVFSPSELVEQAVTASFPADGHATVVLISPNCGLLYKGGIHPLEGSPCEHAGVQDALQGRSGVSYIQSGGDEHVAAFSPVAPAGWALVTEEAWQMVETPTLRWTQFAPLALIPVLLLALLALWFGTRQVVVPIQKLEQQATRLAWGDFDAIEEPVGGIAEIRGLQAELMRMAHKLESARDSLRGYIGAITRGQEDERTRLARELHDDTLQSLIALKQRIQMAEMDLQSDSAENDGRLGELEGLTEHTIQNLRRLTRALRPIYLEDLGLATALQMLARETSQAARIPATFELTGTERRLPPEVELALYRMAQEALSNMARHSDASHAGVRITFQSDQVVLQIKDDGRGFTVPKSPAEFAPSGHFGLMGLYERAELIGARLEIQSSPGQGVELRITLTPGPSPLKGGGE